MCGVCEAVHEAGGWGDLSYWIILSQGALGGATVVIWNLGPGARVESEVVARTARDFLYGLRTICIY
jgi:hypothetical protein